MSTKKTSIIAITLILLASQAVNCARMLSKSKFKPIPFKEDEAEYKPNKHNRPWFNDDQKNTNSGVSKEHKGKYGYEYYHEKNNGGGHATHKYAPKGFGDFETEGSENKPNPGKKPGNKKKPKSGKHEHHEHHSHSSEHSSHLAQRIKAVDLE